MMVVFGILKNEKKNHRVLEKNDYSFYESVNNSILSNKNTVNSL